MTAVDERAPQPPTEPERVVVTEPGVYDLTNEEYHSDPVVGGSLSSTGARRLLDCPAKFRAYLDEPPEPTQAMDVGRIAHSRVLRTDLEVWATDTKGTTKAGIAFRKEAAEAGALVISTAMDEKIDRMADAIRAHPIAGRLLDPDAGWTEQTIVWRDPRTGIMRRAMLDYLPHWAAESGLMIFPDFKSAASSDPKDFGRTMWRYGYHIQGEFYMDGVRALGLAGDATPTFAFIVQEKEPPFIVTVIQYTEQERYWARLQIERALDLYKQCTESGRWPGYSDEIATAELPGYAVRDLEQLQLLDVLGIPGRNGIPMVR